MSLFVDVFSVSDLTGLPSSVIVADRVPLSFSISVHNVDLTPIMPSSNGQPLFSFEVSMVKCFPSFMGGRWTVTMSWKEVYIHNECKEWKTLP